MKPYDKGIFYILRMSGKRWPLRDVEQVSGWQMTGLLAHAFGIDRRDVAREIIERAELLEEGDPYGYQRKPSGTNAA